MNINKSRVSFGEVYNIKLDKNQPVETEIRRLSIAEGNVVKPNNSADNSRDTKNVLLYTGQQAKDINFFSKIAKTFSDRSNEYSNKDYVKFDENFQLAKTIDRGLADLNRNFSKEPANAVQLDFTV